MAKRMFVTLGITALLLAVPFAYDALRIAGAGYLLYLAWQAVRPGGRSPFQVRHLPKDGPKKLFVMGFLTSLLNPKVAVLYLSLLPQFIQSLTKGVDTNIPLWQWPRLLFALIRAFVFGIDSQTITREMVVPFQTSQGAQVLAPNWDAINPLLIRMFGG